MGGSQDRQDRSNDDHAALHGDQQPAPVERVREHPAHQPEQHIGEHVSGLHQRNQDRGVRLMDQQPLRAHRLHPGADIADQRGDPERPEQPHPQRRPGRGRRPRRSRVRDSHAGPQFLVGLGPISFQQAFSPTGRPAVCTVLRAAARARRGTLAMRREPGWLSWR